LRFDAGQTPPRLRRGHVNDARYGVRRRRVPFEPVKLAQRFEKERDAWRRAQNEAQREHRIRHRPPTTSPRGARPRPRALGPRCAPLEHVRHDFAPACPSTRTSYGRGPIRHRVAKAERHERGPTRVRAEERVGGIWPRRLEHPRPGPDAGRGRSSGSASIGVRRFQQWAHHARPDPRAPCRSRRRAAA